MRIQPASCLSLFLALGGCASIDPFTREGVWRPEGTNDSNLRAMVETPADLVVGRGSSGSDGQRAAAAVERLRLDRVRPLPASGIARIDVTGTPGGDSGAAAAVPGY